MAAGRRWSLPGWSEARRIRTPTARRLAGLILVASAGLAVAGCGPAVDQAAATRIATQFLSAGKPSGTIVQNVTVRSVQELAGAWQITIDGQVIVPGTNGAGGSSTSVHEVIDVDKQSGAASLAAQG